MEFEIGNLICTFSNPLVGVIKSKIISAVGAREDDLEREYRNMKEFTQLSYRFNGSSHSYGIIIKCVG